MDQNLELAAVCAVALEAVGRDMDMLREVELPWPEKIEERLREHHGMKAAMKEARRYLDPGRQAHVEQAYKDAISGWYESSNLPLLPMLPDVERRLEEALEDVRRAKLLNRDLDALVRDRMQVADL